MKLFTLLIAGALFTLVGCSSVPGYDSLSGCDKPSRYGK